MKNSWQTTDFELFCNPGVYRKKFPIIRLDFVGLPANAMFVNCCQHMQILRTSDNIYFFIHFTDFNKGVIDKLDKNNVFEKEFKFENEEQFMNILQNE